MSEQRQQFPPGWDGERARHLADLYDNLPEDDQLAEDKKAAIEQHGQTIISVPNELLPAIWQLLAEHGHV